MGKGHKQIGINDRKTRLYRDNDSDAVGASRTQRENEMENYPGTPRGYKYQQRRHLEKE